MEPSKVWGPPARGSAIARPTRNAERGSIAVLAAILLTGLMGFAALGFDLSYTRLARLEMKNATDAAADAAIVRLRDTKNTGLARTMAETVASKNTVLGNAVVLDDTDVQFGSWDYDANTFVAGTTPSMSVQITGRKADLTAAAGTVNTTFGRALGFSSTNIAQTTVSSYRIRATMFEMDITGSFLTASCAIDSAIAADLAFLTDMYGAGVVKDKIGSDVFTGGAVNLTPLTLLNANYNNIYSDWNGDGLSALSSAHTSGLGACTQTGIKTRGNYSCATKPATIWPNQTNITASVPMPTCWYGDTHYAPTTTVYGGTNIGAAIASGIAALNAEPRYESRAIVVFTDGGPMCCEAQGGGNLCPVSNPCCADGTSGSCSDNTSGAACNCASAVAQYGRAQADAAYAANIDVYVLAFGGYTPWIDYAKSLPRGRGFELDTSDPTQLDAKLTQIADAIPTALVQ
jgi:Flp pilus assembly protein TadG